MKTSAPLYKNLIAICAAALLAASSAGVAAAEEGEEWEGEGQLGCDGCGGHCEDGRSFRSQVLGTSNPNKAIEIADCHEGVSAGRYTPLTAAARWGNAKDMKTLLARGANANLRDPDGYTPLLRAIFSNTENVKVLLDNGADANVTSAWGDTALSRVGEDNDAIRVLQAAGAKKNPIAEGATDALGNTALMLAARSGDTKEMQRLIAAGADVNAANQAGNTALLMAADAHQANAVKMLLDKGAKVNAANGEGETALMRGRWSPDVINLLLKKGATVHAQNKNGETALGIIEGEAEAYGGSGEGSPALAILRKAAKKSSGKRK